MRTIATLMFLILGFSTHAGNSIIINEFQYDPDATNGDANGDGTVNTSQDEFVEIYNDTGADVDISGWTLSDGAGVKHTFPANTMLLNQCAVVVFGGGTPTGFFGGAVVQTASTGNISLGNNGDSLTLSDGPVDVATAAFVNDQGDNQSLTRDPDITGATFDPHSTATGSSGLFSPGTLIDGSQFIGCPAQVDTPPEVSGTVPADTALAVSINSNITITFNENIDATASAVTLTCGAVGQSFTGLPFSGDELTLVPDSPLPFDASCDVVVVAAEVSDQDGTVDNMAADYNFSFTVESEAQSQIDLIVNEYQADPDSTNGDANGDGTSDTSQDEFIEIYNNGPDAVDISGWTLSDAVGVRHTFAANTIIDTCKAIVVFGGGTPTGSFGGSATVTASAGFLGLNNGGDSIILNDGNTDRIDMTYPSSSTNESYTLDPDITGLSFVGHTGATGSGGTRFSPGTQIDGTAFASCGGTPTPPRVVSTTPVDGDSGVALDTLIDIQFSEDVTASASAAILTCGVDSVSYSVQASSADRLILDPDVDLPNAITCTVELVATEITDLDDVPDELDGNGDGTAGDNFVFSFFAGIPEVEIFEIQGTGTMSPFTGFTVATNDNIVTAVGTNGFYMQTPDVRDDADASTSNGIFVFTGGIPAVAVGDQIDLTGDVTEFFDLTEFTNPGSYVLNIDSSGNSLPTAVILDGTFPSTDPTAFPCGDQALGYECFEGMYFEMPQGFISAASVGFFGRDRDDVWVNAGTARALREPGIEYPGLPDLPVFDGNPELIEMSVEALNLPPQQLAAGSEVALKGVISFGFGDYELQPTELMMINENVIPGAVRDPQGDEVTVASANLFRLFNAINDPGEEDDDQIADPQEYADRLVKLSRYFVDDMKSPIIIALQEVENRDVLLDLTAAITNYGGPAYIPLLIEGNDRGGIDVAYMYQAGTLANITLTQLGKDELNPFDNSLLHDRPPLRLEADVQLSQGVLSLNLLNVHMRSRSSIDDSAEGDRVRNKRLSQANSVASMIENILMEDPDKSLYVVGDYNAFQFTDGYVDVIGQITGEAVETDNLLWSEPVFVDAPLTQAVQTLMADEQYSFVFRGSAQVLDNAIMNDAGLMNLVEMQYVRGQADANVNSENDNASSLRSTDHDGFVLYIFEDNDLIFKNGFE